MSKRVSKKKLKAAVRTRAKAAGPKKPAIPAVPRTPVWEISPEEQIVGATLLGKVRGYQAAAGAMTLVLEAALAVGETIRVKGRGTDLTQRVEHMELNRQSVQSGTPGETVGITVADRVRVGDAVYKL
jgi:hypothetical protein